METYRSVKSAAEMGIDVGTDISINFSKVMGRQKAIVASLVKGIHTGFGDMNIDYCKGTGTIVGPHSVQVQLDNPQPGRKSGFILEAGKIVIATGSVQRRMSIPGAHLSGVLTHSAIDGLDYGVAAFPFKSTAMAVIMNQTEGLSRLIYEKGSGKLLGGHIFGPCASELIAELTLAVHEGLSVKDLAYLLHFHPSLSENLQRAGRNGRRMEEKVGA